MEQKWWARWHCWVTVKINFDKFAHQLFHNHPPTHPPTYTFVCSVTLYSLLASSLNSSMCSNRFVQAIFPRIYFLALVQRVYILYVYIPWEYPLQTMFYWSESRKKRKERFSIPCYIYTCVKTTRARFLWYIWPYGYKSRLWKVETVDDPIKLWTWYDA